jgi:hypothetical protein
MLVRSVIYQQLAGAAARTIDGRLRAPWRGRYPQPEVLLAAPDAQLRAAGLSRQKIAGGARGRAGVRGGRRHEPRAARDGRRRGDRVGHADPRDRRRGPRTCC